MNNLKDAPAKRKRIFLLLLPTLMTLIAILTYVLSSSGMLHTGIDSVPIATKDTETRIGIVRGELSSPSPELHIYLEAVRPAYMLLPNIDLPPIGAYVSRTGALTSLDSENALPTPLPYATLPPIQDVAEQPESSGNSLFTNDGTPRTLPYMISEGTDCAPSGFPMDGILTQQFHIYHSGIDISAPIGTPVFATQSGQITFVGWNEIGYGYLVILQSGPYTTYYGHNTSFNVIEGQWVGAGSIIAWSGTTGNSTGPHIHYEIRINDIPVDPLTFDNRGFPSC